MVTLVLLRHATAAKAISGQSDHDRQLTPEGHDEARRAGEGISALGLVPDLTLCSTARRTRETLADALEASGGDPETRFLEALFNSGDYTATVQREAGQAECVLLVGHNPFIQTTALLLAGTGAEAPERSFPPAAFAVLTTADGWASLREGLMQLTNFVRP